MYEQLITYKTAVLARAKGFDIPVSEFFLIEKEELYTDGDIIELANHNEFPDVISAPTQSVLQQWLRERNIFLTIRVDSTFEPKFCYSLKWLKEYSDGTLDWLSTNHQNYTFNGKGGFTYSDLYYKYEEALEDGLYEALHIIPN